MSLHNEHTGGATGWCLEVHDLASSKLAAAGGERDLDFLRVLVQERMVDPAVLDRLAQLPLPAGRIEIRQERGRQVTGSGP